MITVVSHENDEKLKLEGMKMLLRQAEKRKKIVADNRSYARYVVDFNWLVDAVNDAERRIK